MLFMAYTLQSGDAHCKAALQLLIGGVSSAGNLPVLQLKTWTRPDSVPVMTRFWFTRWNLAHKAAEAVRKTLSNCPVAVNHMLTLPSSPADSRKVFSKDQSRSLIAL